MAGPEDLIYESGAAQYATQFTEMMVKLCNYMQANYKSGADIVGALRQLCHLVIMMPMAPAGATDAARNCIPPTAVDEHIFKCKFDVEYPREQRYNKNKKSFHGAF